MDNNLHSKRKKLAFQLSFRIVSIIVALLLVLTISTVYLSVVRTEKSVQSNLELTAVKNSDSIESFFRNMQTQSMTLASSLSQLKDLDPQQRQQITEQILSASLKESNFYGVYVAWEPNAFFDDTPLGISTYAFYDGSNINLETLNDYSDYSLQEYYSVTKQSGKPHITEPYLDDSESQNPEWIITVSTPIYDNNGTFLGVTNCDILESSISNIEFDGGGYNSAYTYILSENGTYISNSSDGSKVGSSYDGDKTEFINKVMETGEQVSFSGSDSIVNEDAYYVYQPIQIENSDVKWVNALVVNKSETLQEMWNNLKILCVFDLAGLVGIVLMIVLMIKKLLKPIEPIMKLAADLEIGMLTTDAEVISNNEFGELATIFRSTARTLEGYIKEISSILKRLAEGDLTSNISQDYVGDFAPIKESLIKISLDLNSTISNISYFASQVNQSSNEVSNAAQSLAAGATEQAATIESLVQSSKLVADQANENASNVLNASDNISRTKVSVEDCNEQMKVLENIMGRIGDTSQKISGITKIIEDIAFQTDILALNAAVEAARAGNAGKGFAVVAGEVRSLSERSAEAAKQTSELIGQASDEINDGIKVAGYTARILVNISESSNDTSEVIEKIKTSSLEQVSSIEQVNDGLTQISTVVQSNAAAAEESSALSHELSLQAKNLHNQLDKFKIKGEFEN